MGVAPPELDPLSASGLPIPVPTPTAQVGPAEAAEATGREVIYNADVLHEKLEDFGWSEQERWEETLVITGEAPTTIANVEDDLERELAFYNQAAAATQAAIARMEAAGQAWARPPDYLAEMVKSDEHMAKIKEQMLHQSKLVTEMEQRKKDRESKRFAKQVQAEKKKERAQEKKASISDVSKLRKQRKQSVRGHVLFGGWCPFCMSCGEKGMV